MIPSPAIFFFMKKCLFPIGIDDTFFFSFDYLILLSLKVITPLTGNDSKQKNIGMNSVFQQTWFPHEKYFQLPSPNL